MRVFLLLLAVAWHRYPPTHPILRVIEYNRQCFNRGVCKLVDVCSQAINCVFKKCQVCGWCQSNSQRCEKLPYIALHCITLRLTLMHAHDSIISSFADTKMLDHRKIFEGNENLNLQNVVQAIKVELILMLHANKEWDSISMHVLSIVTPMQNEGERNSVNRKHSISQLSAKLPKEIIKRHAGLCAKECSGKIYLAHH